MGASSQWRVSGRSAQARDLAEALALGRQHIRKLAQAEREAGKRDADARAVGRAIRRALRDQARSRFSIGCRPAPVSGRREGRVRLRSFETMVGLMHPKRNSGALGRPSSFHCKFTGRGLGDRRRVKDRPYQSGEAVRAVRYILRDAAREIENGGIVSSISADPDEIASVLAALEELEATAGRDNANVYMSLVVSLPHELDGPEREALLARICEPLADHDLPYTGVLHSPDPNGDARNYHAHVLFSWRPFRKETDGSYSFSAHTWAELNDSPFITEFRARAAEAMNEAMQAAGHARRFTPLKHSELGEVPRNKADGKSTPGKKHAERRRENIDLGEAERGWLGERQAARARLADVTRSIVVREPDDRRDRVDALQSAEAVITAAKRKPVAQVSDQLNAMNGPASIMPATSPATFRPAAAGSQARGAGVGAEGKVEASRATVLAQRPVPAVSHEKPAEVPTARADRSMAAKPSHARAQPKHSGVDQTAPQTQAGPKTINESKDTEKGSPQHDDVALEPAHDANRALGAATQPALTDHDSRARSVVETARAAARARSASGGVMSPNVPIRVPPEIEHVAGERLTSIPPETTGTESGETWVRERSRAGSAAPVAKVRSMSKGPSARSPVTQPDWRPGLLDEAGRERLKRRSTIAQQEGVTAEPAADARPWIDDPEPTRRQDGRSSSLDHAPPSASSPLEAEAEEADLVRDLLAQARRGKGGGR